MSESELTTKPTLDTVLERLNVHGEALRAQGEVVRNGFGSIGQRLERIEIRLDRIESMVLNGRADFKEFRATFRKPA